MNKQAQKKQIRTALIQRRSALGEAKRLQMSQQIIQSLHEIDDFHQAKSVFCYLSYRSEVDTHHLIDFFLQQGLVLAVPKIIDKTKMIAVPLLDVHDLEPDKLGILTPKSNQMICDPFDLVITPGLGFTVTGARLGFGRGYYDRWFSTAQVKTKIGITFESQIVAELPLEETDVALDILVTEQRIIDLRA